MTLVTELTIESAVQDLIDYRGKTPTKTGSGVRLVTAKVIKRGRIEDNPAEYIAEEFYDAWMRRGLPQEGDSLITTEAPLGEVAMIGSDARVALAQRVILLRANPSILLPQYLYYELQTDYVQAGLAARSSGTTVLGIKQSELRQVKIRVLPLPIQRRVVDILSTYDEMIENNRKRIAILEEMARSLYREWFVHFRYPGHESVPLVESPLGRIPQAWEVARVGSVLSVLGGGTPSRTIDEYWKNGSINWFTPSDLTAAKAMYLDESSEKISEIGLRNSSAKVFPAKSVMMTSRATIGVVAINATPAATNQGFITVIPNEKIPLQYLYQWMKFNVPMFDQHASGATFKELSRGVFKNYDIPLPLDVIVEKFENVASPMGELHYNLSKQNSTLRRTRDLLLPRLMSGTLSVEAHATVEAAVP